MQNIPSHPNEDKGRDIALPAGEKSTAMGFYYLVWAIIMLVIMIYMYFTLPETSPKLVEEGTVLATALLPSPLLYLFSINAAYWFCTGKRRDFFVRVSPAGLSAFFPKERRWFLPGYTTENLTIPWSEIKSCDGLLLIHIIFPVDCGINITKTNGKIVSISSCHFSVGRQELADRVNQALTTFHSKHKV